MTDITTKALKGSKKRKKISWWKWCMDRDKLIRIILFIILLISTFGLAYSITGILTSGVLKFVWEFFKAFMIGALDPR